jgi:hypothetical protein
MNPSLPEQLTPWFPRGSRPARKGFYDTRLSSGVVYRNYWDGQVFYYSNESDEPCGVQDREWRGLAHPATATGRN